MGYYDFSSHQHQIVNAYSRPFTSATGFFSATNSQLRTHFSAPIQKNPDVVTFFHFAGSAWDIGAVVEYKWDNDFGCFDGFLH